MKPNRPIDASEAEATLELWLAREREVRLTMAPPGKIPAEELARTDGLEFVERMGRGEIPSPPIAATLDFVPVEVERGRVVFQGTPKSDYYNPIGSVHGGYIATLLDSAVGCAVQTMLERGFGYTTLELKVSYLRGLRRPRSPRRRRSPRRAARAAGRARRPARATSRVRRARARGGTGRRTATPGAG